MFVTCSIFDCSIILENEMNIFFLLLSIYLSALYLCLNLLKIQGVSLVEILFVKKIFF